MGEVWEANHWVRLLVAGVMWLGPLTRYVRTVSGARSMGMMLLMFAPISARRA